MMKYPWYDADEMMRGYVTIDKDGTIRLYEYVDGTADSAARLLGYLHPAQTELLFVQLDLIFK